MEKDFHFYCVAVLARAAGLNNRDALAIAYASQYVDDAIEDQSFIVKIDGKRVDYKDFHPTTTSHSSSQAIMTGLVYDIAAQNIIWVPFHFPPGEFSTVENQDTASLYVTKGDSACVEWYLDESIQERNELLRLCRVGIALHAYADAWAHEGFSGRDDMENDVQDLYLFALGTNKWKSISLLDKFGTGTFPRIGHVRAGHVPDLPHLKWKCKLGGAEVVRDNTEHSLNAAKSIYGHLRRMRESFVDYEIDPLLLARGKKAESISWEDLEPQVRRLFRGRKAFSVFDSTEKDLEEACRKWERRFGHWFQPYYYPVYMDPEDARGKPLYHYDVLDCRKDVFVKFDWNHYSGVPGIHESKKDLAGFTESFWYNFHTAAMLHWELVHESLRDLTLVKG